MLWFTAIVMISALAWGAFEAWRWWTNTRCRDAFGASLQFHTLRQQVQTLQTQLLEQRRQIEALQTQLAALAVAQQTAASQRQEDSGPGDSAAPAVTTEVHPSPEYAEAMAWARRGATAEELVQRCGISLAEAQLLCALSQSVPAMVSA